MNNPNSNPLPNVSLASSSTNDIFRFVSVRAVNSPEKDAFNRRFIFCDISENSPHLQKAIKDAREAKKPITPLLIAELPKLVGHNEPEMQMLQIVSEFQTNSNNRMSLSDVERLYPTQLYNVYLWHRDNNNYRNISREDFIKQVEKSLTGSVADFINADRYFMSKVKLWENLIAEYIKPTNSAFLDQLVNMIRWFWIIEKLNNGKTLLDGQEIYEAMHATVVLPNNAIHFEPKTNPKAEPQTRSQAIKAVKEKDMKRLEDLKYAVNDILLANKNQTTDTKYSGIQNVKEVKLVSAVQTDLPLLAQKYVASLNAKTHSVLESIGLIKGTEFVVAHAIERIDNEKNAILDRVRESVKPPVMININNNYFWFDDLCHHYTPPDPCAPYNEDGSVLPVGVGLIRFPGIADLRVIKSTLLKYEKGEIAHIENVLKGETKIRQFNTLKRSEETLMTEEESTSENEKDTQTTDRFELEKEMSQTSKEDSKTDTGVKVTASYGPVTTEAHLNYVSNSSKEESNKTATKNSQEMVNRAVSKLIERKKTQKTVTTIIQTEDNNSHTLDNKTGDNNIHGIYRWLDKYYLAKVINYGKRIMFEFVVPEPAAFYLYAKTNKPIDKYPPVHPYLFNIFSFNDINDDTYIWLTSFYEVQDVVPPPPDIQIISTTLRNDKPPLGKDAAPQDQNDNDFTITDNDKLKIPDGYLAHHADISFAIKKTQTDTRHEVYDGGWWGTGINENHHTEGEVFQSFHILIGNKHLQPNVGDSPLLGQPLNREDEVIPVSIKGNDRHFIANIEIICNRTDMHYREWKIKIFNSILASYDTKLKEFEDWKTAQSVNAGITIQGNNPDINRQVEKEELKKHCIEMITGQRFESFDAMRSNVPDLGFPEFSILESFIEGNYIQFFEQVFEWEQMTYMFYPYYWGRKPNWVNIKSINDPDPIFTNFLQAGAARVLVPARLEFGLDILNYFFSGGRRFWLEGQAPVPGDPRYLSIVDELKEQEGQFTGGAQEGEPWIYKVPTTLVMLDDINADLPDNTNRYPFDVKTANSVAGTGTVSGTIGTNALIGIGTLFTTEAKVGDKIIFANGELNDVMKITDDTHIVLLNPLSGTLSNDSFLIRNVAFY